MGTSIQKNVENNALQKKHQLCKPISRKWREKSKRRFPLS